LELYAAWKVKEAYQHSSWTQAAKSMATRLSEFHLKKKVLERQLLYKKK